MHTLRKHHSCSAGPTCAAEVNGSITRTSMGMMEWGRVNVTRFLSFGGGAVQSKIQNPKSKIGSSVRTSIRYTLSLFLLTPLAWGYPEFQQYVQRTSGRNVNCAMCHAHPDGPEGLKPGQIGSLAQPELDLLGRARAAFEPGQNVDNPILNEFGDSIIKKLGKTKLLQLRLHPEEMSTAIGADSDLDNDGVADSAEYVAGTDPLDEGSGPPLQLVLHNLRENAFNLIMMVIATAAGIYGLNAVLHGFDQVMRMRKDAQSGEV